MNNTSLLTLTNQRIEFLKKRTLDSESIKEFRKKIKSVSEEEAMALGKELFDLISKKGFNDDFEKVVELIYKGANIEYKNERKGDFALLVCARKNYFKTFLALLKAGANVDQVNNYLTTAVMACARHGFKEMLEILIMMGADINARCLDGDNAIMGAKRHDKVDCFNLLVESSAYLTNRNIDNQTIIDIPSTANFDLSVLPATILPPEKEEVSFEDTENLLNEAIKKLEKIKNS